MFRNAKTREIMVGADDKVEQCTYFAAVTRVEEELGNELTGGWKVIEVSYPLLLSIIIVLWPCYGSKRYLTATTDSIFPFRRWHADLLGRIYRRDFMHTNILIYS